MVGNEAAEYPDRQPPNVTPGNEAPLETGALFHCAASEGMGHVLSPEKAERLRWTRDPRWADAPEDRNLWMLLLDRAYTVDGIDPNGLFGSLHGIRSLGARIELTPTSARIKPGEIESGDYFAIRRQYLQPWAQILKGLLHDLATTSIPSDRTRSD